MKKFLRFFNSKILAHLFLTLSFIFLFSNNSSAQDAIPSVDSVTVEDSVYSNATSGEFTPGKGYTIFENKMGSLNLSAYGLARYVNQIDDDNKYTDHLGREIPIDARQDIMWHRTMFWMSGFFYTPKLRYCITIWGLVSTNQTLVFGYLQYSFMKQIRLGVGIGPNLATRSMQGPWPFMLSSDRVLAEEYFRSGFTSGVWMTGELFPSFNYTLMLGDNLSILGTTVSQLTRNLSTSASVWWMPTTGEFGLRGGYGDFEEHQEVATRFGASYNHMRDNRQNPVSEPKPNNTQVKLSDATLFYETGALAEGVTVTDANFDLLAIDAGVKYKGWHFQVEYYYRQLSKFNADGPLPLSSITDNGFYASLSYQLIPKFLQLYGSTTKIYDEFKRYPWEVIGGLSFYPSGTRSWRLNVNAIYVYLSPASLSFGFYLGGLTGMSLSIGTDILL